MASNTKWAVPNNPTGTTLLTTELNSLTTGSYALAGAAFDNTGNLDLYADFALVAKYTGSAPSAGTLVAQLYLLPSIDGIHYASVDGSNQPQGALLIAAFESRAASTSSLEYLMAPGIPLPPRKFKTVLLNSSGQTFAATGNQVVMGPYQLQNA